MLEENMKHFTKKFLLCIGILFFSTFAFYSQKNNGIVQLSLNSVFQIDKLNINTENVGLYEKFEISFDLTGEWDNPFDPEQIKVDAVFIAPSGEKIIVPGFFYQEYRKEDIGLSGKPILITSSTTRSDLIMIGEPIWKVRFSPMQIGEYSWYIKATNKDKEIVTQIEKFDCFSYDSNKGFLRISRNNPLYFEFDDGTSFFGIAKGRQQGNTYPDIKTYERFANSGGNFNRLFLTNGPLNLGEMLPIPFRPDRGIGKYNMEGAWHLDRVLEDGEKYGIYHILTLTNQWTFNQQWAIHSYNAKNGGPIEQPAEYWTNEIAQQYFEKFLRYMVARWGYSTSVFSWDLWNEYSAMPGSNIAVSIPWHQRMSKFLRSIDPYKHIIHTNDGSLNGRDAMNALPEMEFISSNIYMVRNMAKVAEDITKQHTSKYGKPYVLTEFGTGHSVNSVGGYAGMDPERRMVHNGLWAPVVSGGATTGMAWEGNWLDHKIFYTYLKALSMFVDRVQFSKNEWHPVKISSFNYKDKTDKGGMFGDVIVEGWSGNYRLEAHTPDIFQIDHNGNVDHQASLNAVLENSTKSNRNSSVIFQMNYPAQGEFVVCVSEIRDTTLTPTLSVKVDGRKVLNKALKPLNEKDYQPLMYNQYYSIPVDKGNHKIQVENTGGGSFVTSFELRNFIENDGPKLEVRGIQSQSHILLWFKNQKFTLLHSLMNINWEPQPEGVITIVDVPNGKWIAEWINTINATIIKKELIENNNHQLILNTPIVNESVAVRLYKIT